jgi:segregation and condensation protein A
MAYEIKLDVFEGPLDLLLYLIKKNEIDIYNIPIAAITEEYLKHLEAMKSLNLDLAGEYLVMASTLVHIKSRMLLPVSEEDAELDEADPRAELVRQLLEYKAFKEAALSLGGRSVLGRDVFRREAFPEREQDRDEQPLVELSIFDLIEAFQKVLSTMKKEDIMEIEGERFSLTDTINEIIERLQSAGDVTFNELLGEGFTRRRLVYNFLAILELMKLKMIRACQAAPFGVIRIFLAVEE